MLTRRRIGHHPTTGSSSVCVYKRELAMDTEFTDPEVHRCP
jgi:hypothetical protein